MKKFSFKATGVAYQSEALALGGESLRGVATITVTPGGENGPESRQIGPCDNNLRIGVEARIMQDTDVALREYENCHEVRCEFWKTGFWLSIRGGTEAALMLSALRDALNKLDLQTEYGPCALDEVSK